MFMSQLPSFEFVIREMLLQDIDIVIKLCNDCGVTGWVAKDYENKLTDENSISLIAVIKNKIIYENIAGFLLARVISPESEILNIAVSHKFRRMDIGSSLIDALLIELSKRNVETIWLEVRASNNAAIGLYEKKGFYVVGKRYGYYSLPTEDALLMYRNCV